MTASELLLRCSSASLSLTFRNGVFNVLEYLEDSPLGVIEHFKRKIDRHESTATRPFSLALLQGPRNVANWSLIS